ncbi:MAG: sulfurtransferase [Polyangiaceae bacterium]
MARGPFRPSSSPLVSARWLLEHAADPDVRVLDARWYLGGKSGAAEFANGHIPGAAFADLDRDLSAPKGTGPGRHPLPSAGAFAAALARLGIGATTRVIAYDDAGGSIAARVWWLFRHFGLPAAAVLDGGLAAWTAAGGALSKETPAIVPAPSMRLVARTDDVVDKRAVDRLRSQGDALVIDARATERFEGKSEPIDARPGHVPGARSLPWPGNLATPGGPFAEPRALAERYEKAGAARAKSIVCYCGSGVTACHDLIALALAGRPDALLYEGSWSDWAADASLPAALGSD